MIDMLKRHEIQVLRRAEHTWSEIAALSGVSEKTARRIAAETPVTTVDNAVERLRRQVGRPSKAEVHRDVLVQALTEDAALRSVELLHRARLAGYTGGKSAVYALAQTLRTRGVTPLVRFEGLPGEFSQHDFGEVWITYQDGSETKVHFFASRLKYAAGSRSCWSPMSGSKRSCVRSLSISRALAAFPWYIAHYLGTPMPSLPFEEPERPPTISATWLPRGGRFQAAEGARRAGAQWSAATSSSAPSGA
jgi:hypothetical protein